MRRVRLLWWRYKWSIVIVFGLVGFALGYIGLHRYYQHPPKGVTRVHNSAADLLWLDIKLLTARSSLQPPLPWELEIAQFLPLVVVYGAVSGLVAMFRDRVQQARLPFLRRHVVVAGLGVKGLSFVDAMRSSGSTVVAIESNANEPNITAARALGAIVLVGDARNVGVLTTAGVARARHLLVTADDATNVEVALQAQALTDRRRGSPLECLAHVVDPDVCALLKLHALRASADPRFRVDFFNFDDQAARMLCRDTDDAHNVVVIGQGNLSDRLVLHSVSGASGTPEAPTTVTLVDRAATTRVEALKARFPSVGRSGRLHALDQTRDDLIIDGAKLLADEEGGAVVYLADIDEAANVELALGLKDSARATGSRIIVCTERADGLASLLDSSDASASSLGAITAVPLARRTCTRELVTDGIYDLLGRAIHAEYVAERTAEGASPADDPSLVPWDELDESLKSSNRSQAQQIGVKLSAVGCDLVPLQDAEPVPFTFSDDEMELLARMEHDRWMAERRAAGWKPGPVRDVHERRTPYLVPWEQLTEEIRDRDRETVRKLPSYAAAAGFQVIRLSPSTAGVP